MMKAPMKETSYFATKELKKARKAKGYSVSEVVQLLNLQSGIDVSDDLYHKWEQGVRSLSIDSILELARILRVEVGVLARRR